MQRFATIVFGSLVYLMFLGVFLYAVGFIGNFAVPTRLDGAARTPAGPALLIDLSLVALFAVQHSVMARPWFKHWLTRYIPTSVERSLYVLAANLVLALLFWQWQPIDRMVWNVQSTWGRVGLYGLFAAGWLTVLITTFLINHFDLFGLRQVWQAFHGRSYSPLGFMAPGPYQLVRHPMYIGWLTVFWATPTMSVAHLTFAAGMTAYILVAITYEERDLVQALGEHYADYRRSVPMLIPRIPRRPQAATSPAEPEPRKMTPALGESAVST